MVIISQKIDSRNNRMKFISRMELWTKNIIKKIDQNYYQI